MPIPEGSKNIPIRPTIIFELTEKWNEERNRKVQVHKQFGGYVNDLLQEIIDKDKFLDEYAPNLSEAGVNDNVLFIRDSKISSLIEVVVQNKELKCIHDKSFNCIHVKFALAIPEVAKLDLKKPI